MKKRTLSMMLAGASALMMITACGGDDSSGGSENDRGTSAPQSSETSKASETTQIQEQGGNSGGVLGFGEDILPPPEWFFPLIQGELRQITPLAYTAADVDVSVSTFDSSFYQVVNTMDRPIWHFAWSELYGNIEAFRRIDIIEPGESFAALPINSPFLRDYRLFIPEPEGFEMFKAMDLGNGWVVINSNSSEVLTSRVEFGNENFLPWTVWWEPSEINNSAAGYFSNQSYNHEIDLLMLDKEEAITVPRTRHHYLVANFVNPHVVWVCFETETPMAVIRNASAAWYRVDSQGNATSMMTSTRGKRATADGYGKWSFLIRSKPDNGDIMELRVFCLETDELIATHRESFVSEYTPFDWGVEVVGNHTFH
jgi:hypothetical protein